ncbi:ribonuclease D [Limimonas halophila]|uniref:Ribonuclease D n=1 Tax=Limimonas halophila TaxID=1082479 RepID=A0A1G7TCI0_9PROT|nr:ribonuclease D [Limimonas halophila]SDG33008.1 ribonuclease D [Limimonas halophila]
MAIHLHENDIPADLDLGTQVAIDTETMGLNLNRDRLCVIQLSAGDGDAHIVQVRDRTAPAPNLRALVADRGVEKLFHFARFDVAHLQQHFGVACRPVFCTKIASRLTRTFTDKHGLKDLCLELLGVELSKMQQSSDWGAAELSRDQLAYAAQDVLYLHQLRERTAALLEREGRAEMARACFDFLPWRAELDVAGWDGVDIFAHH